MLQAEVLIIILLLLNILFQGILLYKNKNDSESWSDGFGGLGDDTDDYGQKTYAGCNCSRVSTKTSQNAPFNDDSFLYKKE
jgi:hypothetical protein